MKKSDKQQAVQMYLSEKEEWTKRVPVLDGVAVSYAAHGQEDECLTGGEKQNTLTTELLEQIITLPNLEQASRQVINNGGSAGIDGMTVKELKTWLNKNWRELQESIRLGNYQVSGVRLVEIPKPKGGYRQLCIPTVKDRMIQQAIHQILNPIFDRSFSPTSYGFRKGRSAHDALSQLSHYLKGGRTYVVDIDMAKFFDEVNHDRLLNRLSQKVKDKGLLGLIHQYLKAGILKDGLTHQRIKGTPQGSPLSPLLSNIVLDELDKELSRRGHRYVRYADDLVILVGSQKAAERVKRSTTTYIENHLKLKVNKTKSRICRPLDLNYLGHRFMGNGQILLSQESEERLKSKIRQTTQRNRGRSFEQIIKELTPLLRGWLNYFKAAAMKKKLKSLDSWIRKRLRCYRLKQCKRAIGMMRFLRKLGVPENRCWTTAASRKGWWRKSSTPASQEGMNNKWFKEQGLYNLVENYLSFSS